MAPRSRLWVPLLMALVACDDGGSPTAPVAARVLRQSGDGQEGLVGTRLLDPLVVILADGEARPIVGSVVIFEVAAGDARLLSESAVTDSLGRASAAVILGSTAGMVRIRASSPAAEVSAEFTLTSRLPQSVESPDVPGAPDDGGAAGDDGGTGAADYADHALRFDAALQQEVAIRFCGTTGDQYTAEAWVRLSQSTRAVGEGGEILGMHGSTVDAMGTLDVFDMKLRFLINTDRTEHHELLSATPLPVGQWVHVCGVYDGWQMRVFTSGVQDGSLPVRGTIADADLRRTPRIGGYAGGVIGPYWFSGEIDEVRVWSVARTEEQIRESMFHPIRNQPGLLCYWRFDEGVGAVTADLSGHFPVGSLTSCDGESRPTWVPGVFTQIDSTAIRRW